MSSSHPPHQHPSTPSHASHAQKELVPSLLLHHATFRNDASELGRLLQQHKYDVNAVDLYGNTPLHIAVMMAHAPCIDILVSHGAKVSLKNKAGWNPIHEATSLGDRVVLAKLWTSYKKRARESQEFAGLLGHLHKLPDFRAVFQYKVSSWLPLIGRFLPSDNFTIAKRGTSIRIDCNLLDFKNMTWIRHPFSFLLKPKPKGEIEKNKNFLQNLASSVRRASGSDDFFRAGSPEAEASQLNPRQPFLVLTMDHETKQWNLANVDEEEEQKRHEEQQKAAAKAAAKPSNASKSSDSIVSSSALPSSSSSSSSSSPPHDVDLEFELDDFQSAPITSAFSPGRLIFRPLLNRNWGTWAGWTSLLWWGGSSNANADDPKAKYSAPPPTGHRFQSELIGQWNARVYAIENIRIHILRRYEHLTQEEREALHARGAKFRSMVSNPAKMAAHLQQSSNDDENEEEADESSDEEQEEGHGEHKQTEKTSITKPSSAAKSVAELDPSAKPQHQQHSEKSKKPKKKVTHHASLAVPPACPVPFESYFHAGNQVAYSAVEAEELFSKERERAHEEQLARAAESGEVDHEEVLVLKEDERSEADGTQAAGADSKSDQAEGASSSETHPGAAAADGSEENEDGTSQPRGLISGAHAHYTLVPENTKYPYIHLGRRKIELEVAKKKVRWNAVTSRTLLNSTKSELRPRGAEFLFVFLLFVFFRLV
jgi:hypothetical protein